MNPVPQHSCIIYGKARQISFFGSLQGIQLFNVKDPRTNKDRKKNHYYSSIHSYSFYLGRNNCHPTKTVSITKSYVS